MEINTELMDALLKSDARVEQLEDCLKHFGIQITPDRGYTFKPTVMDERYKAQLDNENARLKAELGLRILAGAQDYIGAYYLSEGISNFDALGLINRLMFEVGEDFYTFDVIEGESNAMQD
jgi:hypothetical protein